jgi:hypothetical protein
MDFKSIIEGFAKIGLPILGAALPVPGGMAIGTAIASMIGSDSTKPEDILNTLTLDSAARQKAIEFQLTHQETLVKLQAEQEVREYEAEVADRTSARTMQTTTQSIVPPLLAGLLTVGYFGILALKIIGTVHTDDASISELLTTLRDGCMVAWTFYFGSSHGSRQKDDVIAAQAVKQPA